MEYTGLIRKYPVDRLLSEGDNQGRVAQGTRLDVLPHPHLATLRLNEIYLELVDKFYDRKGFLTITMLALICLGIAQMALIPYGMRVAARSPDDHYLIWLLLLLFFAVLGLTGLAVWLFRREAFRLTHYPIRLTRKTRKVCAFDARTLKVVQGDWDSMFFTIVPTRTRPIGITQWEILGEAVKNSVC